MARGRELAAKGVKGKEREETRWKEIESGAIKMSREPRTLHVLSGSGFDPATGTIADAYLRWVIYTPFATPETTGLAHPARARRALADVSGNAHGAHHDQPAAAVQVAPMSILLATLTLLGVTLIRAAVAPRAGHRRRRRRSSG